MTKTTDWIGIGLGIIGVTTVVIGVYTCCTSLRKKRGSDDIGSICLNKRLMGLFKAKEPLGWLMGREVRILELPTLYGVLRAGEANKWTSALVEGIYDNLDDEVCWRQLYEQFFFHLAWKEPSGIKDARLKTITDRASTIIQREKKKAMKTPSILDLEIRIDQLSLKLGWCLLWLLCLVKKFGLSCVRKCQLWCCGKCRGKCRGKYKYHRSHNRLLLYEKILDRAPVLQDCVRLLEKLNKAAVVERGEDPLYGYESIWDRHLRPIWILGKRPCLLVSTEQLLGFCLAFGINLKRRGNQAYDGSGAYGLMVNVSSQDDYLRIHVAHPRRGPRLQASKGNGYSILFAKLMACGCLPFARTPAFTKSIHVNQDTHNAIRWGLSIKDAKDYPTAPSTNFLGDLPGQTNDDYYCVAGLIVHFTYGHICNSEYGPLQPGDPADRWTWAKAVAGIAFGGFVPQATRNLVSAVQFTVLGADNIGGTPEELIEDIEVLIDKVHEWDEEYELFGTYIARRQIAARAQRIDYVFKPCGIADGAAIFSRYATLLERFLGIVAEKAGATTKPEAVYDALVSKLRDSHKQAVYRFTDRHEAGQLLDRGFRGYIEELEGFKAAAVTTASRINSCAVLARILILAWTYQVNLVRWRKETEPQADLYSIAKHQGTRLLTARGIQNSNKLGVLGL